MWSIVQATPDTSTFHLQTVDATSITVTTSAATDGSDASDSRAGIIGASSCQTCVPRANRSHRSGISRSGCHRYHSAALRDDIEARLLGKFTFGHAPCSFSGGLLAPASDRQENRIFWVTWPTSPADCLLPPVGLLHALPRVSHLLSPQPPRPISPQGSRLPLPPPGNRALETPRP